MRQFNDTAHKILDVAERYTQTQGFNAFSYKDLQEEVGVKTSTMHYYFPTKQDLGAALVERYTTRFIDKLDDIGEQSIKAPKKLRLMMGMFVDVASYDFVCLCGMLASDMLSLTQQGREGLRYFFKESERWTARVIKQGIQHGDFANKVEPEEAAMQIVALMQGALLLARVKHDDVYMSKIVQDAIKNLEK